MVWRRFRRHRLAVAGAVVILLMYAVAIFAPWLAPYDPNQMFLLERLKGPSTAHWLGQDDLGRDVLSRVIYGARVSLTVGFIAAGISAVLGVTLGAIAGYYGRWADMIIMRIVDVLMSFPQFLLILAVVAVLKPSLINIMVVLGLTGWSEYARIVRGSVLALKDQEFVIAARAMGVPGPTIIFRHLLRNAMAPVIVVATLNVAGAILLESGLSFLGFGAQPPTASWGNIISAGKVFLKTAPHVATAAGVAIFITVLSFNLVGDGLRDALDPKMKV